MSDVQNTESLKIFLCLTMYIIIIYIIIVSITVKPVLSGHLRDLPKCLLNRGCPLNRGFKNCTMFVNDQHLTVTLYSEKVACC